LVEVVGRAFIRWAIFGHCSLPQHAGAKPLEPGFFLALVHDLPKSRKIRRLHWQRDTLIEPSIRSM